jgi:hypothetical protein
MDINAGEVAIILRPMEDDKGEWTGELKTGIMFGDERMPDGMRAALDVALTMASAQFFLEDNPEYLEEFDYHRSEILKDIFPDFFAESEAELEEMNKIERDGNVIKLNRWTKTEGSA